MSELPDDVGAALVRGIGSYIRAQPVHELPAELKRFRSFRPQALAPHGATLLGALDNEATRARIKHWLETEKPSLPKAETRLLTIATSRDDGWEEELLGSSRPRHQRQASKTTDNTKLEAERDKARKAKDELKKARDQLRTAEQRSAARISELEAIVEELRSTLTKVERRVADATKKADEALDRAERSQRKAKKAVEKANEDRDAARKEAKELRKELTAARPKEVAQPPAAAPKPSKRKAAPAARSALRVPKGRLGDDPETLKKWLARDDVRLVIDGYNVAKADGGYEDLQLESQRERLVDALFKLAKMTGTETIVVFDAQRVPGRRSRKSKRPVVIEWSNPGEIADDYIVSRLEELPPDPVILVTNDKELQERGRALAATIATSQQLLALIR
jgi:predicted RNA-binding protein with PIN domain